MKFFTHYKTSMPEEENILNKMCYSVGLFIPNIIFLFPPHKYEKSKERIKQLLFSAEKANNLQLKAFLVGMANHYIGDAFSYEMTIDNIIEKQTYAMEFSNKLEKYKKSNIDNEITRSVKNYFNIMDISGSIENLHGIYSHVASSKCELDKRIMFDYLFIHNITQRVYTSIVA